jgi:signal transduction histidine kinase
MDIYQQKDRWKIYLAIGGVGIILVSILYTNYLAHSLGEEERNKIRNWALAQQQIIDGQAEELQLHLQVIQSNQTIPVILVNNQGEIEAADNFGPELDQDMDFLKQELRRLQESGVEPIQGEVSSIYYKESTLLRQLRYFPLIQFLLIGVFIILGYIGFSSARKSEQNRVWAGMAKETAHQLGTPISAISAWVEHLRSLREKDPEVVEVANELEKDLDRLELITERFSKIGSQPELQTVNLITELERVRLYMKQRAPRQISFEFPEPGEKLLARVNPPLFNWVMENLLRNALDAMDGKGSVQVDAYPWQGQVAIDITDSGKGIPSGKRNTVFKPGFTTKKRGWGLGLSLAKRIIEQYHHGKIFVKWSEEGKGTTFTILLASGEPSPTEDIRKAEFSKA